jgi:2-oxoglutarate dehydrogenase E1 component
MNQKRACGVMQEANGEDSGDGAADAGQYKTGLPLETIQQVGRQLTDVPEGFTPHPDVEKLLARRRRMVAREGSRVDFSFAELLAFCTLSLRRPKGM